VNIPDPKAVSQFIALTRIVRVAVILDHLFEFIEDTLPQGHPVWDLYHRYSEENERDFQTFLDAVRLDLMIIRIDPPDPGDNNDL